MIMEGRSMATMTIPVCISPEAAERIAERRLQAPIDQMIEQAVKMVPGIRRVEISLEGPYDTHDEPYLHAVAFRDPRYYQEGKISPEKNQYDRWIAESLPDDVRWQVMLNIYWDSPDER
jgi:hypothetical protein